MGSVCTGEYLDPEVPQSGCWNINAPCVIGERPVNPNQLFDANSTSEYSRSFQVVEGACVQLTAYCLAGATVQIEKLYLDPSANLPVILGACVDPPAVPPAAILACKAICNWQLTDCEDLRYVCAAGVYRLHLTPPSALGQAFVVMERMNKFDHPVPDGLVLGAA